MKPDNYKFNAVTLIFKDHSLTERKNKYLNTHIEYLIKMSKKDKSLASELSQFNLIELLQNPYLVYDTVINELAKDGVISVLNLSPNMMRPTNVVIVYLPLKTTNYQKEVFYHYMTPDIEFLGFSQYDKDLGKVKSINEQEIYTEDEIKSCFHR